MIYDTAGNKIQEPINCGNCRQDTAGNHEWNCPNKNSSRYCFFNGNKMVHIWTYSGDPNYFPYEGMLCDCGEVRWHKPN
jgi:hypothetical protein